MYHIDVHSLLGGETFSSLELDLGSLKLNASDSFLALSLLGRGYNGPGETSRGKNVDDFVSVLRLSSSHADLRAHVLMNNIVRSCAKQEVKGRGTIEVDGKVVGGSPWRGAERLAYNPVDQSFVRHHPLIEGAFFEPLRTTTTFDRGDEKLHLFLEDNKALLRSHGWAWPEDDDRKIESIKNDVVTVTDFSMPLGGFYSQAFHRADHFRVLHSDRTKNELFVRLEKRELLKWEQQSLRTSRNKSSFHAHYNKSRPHAPDSYLQRKLNIFTPAHLEACPTDHHASSAKNLPGLVLPKNSASPPKFEQEVEQPGRSLFCSEVPLSSPPVDEEYLQYLSLVAAVGDAAGASERRTSRESPASGSTFSYAEWGAGYGVWTARAARLWRRAARSSSQLHDCVLSLVEPVTYHIGDALRFVLQNRLWADCRIRLHDRFLGPVEPAAVCYCGRALTSTKQCSCKFRKYKTPTSSPLTLPRFGPGLDGANGYRKAMPIDQGVDVDQTQNGLSGGENPKNSRAVTGDQLSGAGVLVDPKNSRAVTGDQLSGAGVLVDLLDLDVQEQELEVVPRILNFLTQKVRRIHIGTHTRFIHAKLRTLLKQAGFQVLMDFPCGRIFEGVTVGDLSGGISGRAGGGGGGQTKVVPEILESSLGTILLRDGVLSAVNTKFL